MQILSAPWSSGLALGELGSCSQRCGGLWERASRWVWGGTGFGFSGLSGCVTSGQFLSPHWLPPFSTSRR